MHLRNLNRNERLSQLEECESEAERFCLENFDWVIETSRRAALRRDLQEYEEDIAHEVFKKARNISANTWARTKHKRAYVARVIINCANDLSCEDRYEPLSDNIISSTPIEAMEAAILIDELFQQLSPNEQRLFELLFEQFSGEEIAKSMKISHSTVRKRISRLKEKLGSLSHKTTNAMVTDRIATKRQLAS
jgi:RNA polymerase sigma factor (sigma-70 family)